MPDLNWRPLGRETKAEVVLTSRLKPALERLNPELPPEAIDLAMEELTRDRLRMSLAAANHEVYNLTKNGVRVEIPEPDGEDERVEIVPIIDWDNPDTNDFLLCSQFWIRVCPKLIRPSSTRKRRKPFSSTFMTRTMGQGGGFMLRQRRRGLIYSH